MTPLKQLIDVSPDERALRAGWEAIESRLPSPRRRRSRRRWLALAGAVAAAGIVLAAVQWQRSAEPAPLALADGTPLPAELVADTGLSDGSTIAIASGRLELLASEPRAVRWLLATGTARFAIRPGGPRRWTIDIGVAQVEVVGTEFTVSRAATGVDVAVAHGIVVVRGDRVPGLVRRLQAGEQLRIPTAITAEVPASPAAPPAPPVIAAAPPAPPPATPVAASVPPTTSSAPSATTIEAKPAPPGAAEPARSPLESPAVAPPVIALLTAVPTPSTTEPLLARADDLRRHGDRSGAAAVLDQIRDAPGDPLSAIARFTRARILIDLGRRVEAAADLQRAITAGLPPLLEARAKARLAELTHGASQ